MKRTLSLLVLTVLMLSLVVQAETFSFSEINAEIDLPPNWGKITKTTNSYELPSDLVYLIGEMNTKPDIKGFVYYYDLPSQDVLVAQLMIFSNITYKKQTGISKADFEKTAEEIGKAFRESNKFDGNISEKLIEGKDVNFVRMSGKMDGIDTIVYITAVNGLGFGAVVQYLNRNTLLAFEHSLSNMDVEGYEKGTDNESFNKQSFWERFVGLIFRDLSWQIASLLVFGVGAIIFGIGALIKKVFTRN